MHSTSERQKPKHCWFVCIANKGQVIIITAPLLSKIIETDFLGDVMEMCLLIHGPWFIAKQALILTVSFLKST